MSRVLSHVIVHGRVQGVGFRAFVTREALKRGVEGWVRNRKDETVEAVFAGPAQAVDEVVEACRRGPFNARVDGLDRREASEAEFALRHADEMFSELPDK